MPTCAGRGSPDWLPDWTGETVAILASGPSARAADAEACRLWAVRLVVVNCAWILAPRADLLYACDPKWWRQPGDAYGLEARRRFAGLKVCPDRGFCEAVGDVHHVRLERTNTLVTEPGVIGSGLSGGFQALNLAVHTGARRVLLLGYDMHGEDGLHFHPAHPEPLGMPDRYTFDRFRSAFNNAEAALRQMGVEVINCTPGSRLTVFPQMTLSEALG